jgi:hypothetical protein
MKLTCDKMLSIKLDKSVYTNFALTQIRKSSNQEIVFIGYSYLIGYFYSEKATL